MVGEIGFDKRYELAGYSVSKFELYKEYGIISKLHRLPYDERYIDYEAMANETMSLWARSIINWRVYAENTSNPPIEIVETFQAQVWKNWVPR